MSDYNPNHISKKSYSVIGQKAIVLNDRSEILILQRSSKSGLGGKWSLPGGGLEDGEKPYDSINREIKEETGLEVSRLKPYYLFTYYQDSDFYLAIGYSCKADSEDVVLNWEHDDFKWLLKENVLKLDLSEHARVFLENFNAP